MSTALRAIDLGILSCVECGQACRATPAAPEPVADPEAALRCPRCAAPVHLRKPASYTRTLALLIAAVILYIPANLMIIMTTVELTGTEEHTILGGIAELWQDGEAELAIIVFVASIFVPIFKLIVLTLLLVSVRQRWQGYALTRARLYRAIETVGPWSMLDVFVVVLLTALVQFNNLAQVQAGPGALAFGAVVVLTMLASRSFDPRLIWDARERSGAPIHPPPVHRIPP